MPITIYCDANPKRAAILLPSGVSVVRELQDGLSSMEAEYEAVKMAVEYLASNLGATDSLIEVKSDNKVVVEQLNHNYHIGKDELRKLAQHIWLKCTSFKDVRFTWIPREENIAGKLLK